MHFAVFSDLDLLAISSDFNCILTLLFHFSTVTIVLSVTTTPLQTSLNCSPNSKEVTIFNYLYYIYRE